MLIEDIDFLQENSAKSSFMAFVDSAKRDMVTFPTPSEYVVEFEDPFRLVFGVEILDATIPTTMFDVDVHNDRFCHGRVSTSTSELIAPEEKIARLKASFARACQNKRFLEEFNRIQNATLVYTELEEKDAFENAPSPTSDALFYFNFRKIPKDPDDEDDTCKWEVVLISASEKSLKTEVPAIDPNYFKIELFVAHLEHGNYDIKQLAEEINTQVPAISVVSSSSRRDYARQARYQFQRTDGAMFFLDMAKSSLSTLLGFSSVALPASTSYATFPSALGTQAQRIYLSSQRTDDDTYVLQAPGAVNIEGPKYVVLRCKEIEEHIYTSYYSSKYSNGMGIFKLVSANNVAFLRFDFVNLLRKPFHPIGKLSRLTFRFELPDGSLYDFKGVDHYMLLSINYYSPERTKRSNMPSVLNPNYDPNYVNYMIKYMDRNTLDPSSETRMAQVFEEKELLKQHNLLDFSSSEEEDDDAADSSESDSDSDEGSEQDLRV